MYDFKHFFIKKINFSRETSYRLQKYEKILIEYNKKINLISKSTEKDIYNRHFIDCAQVIDFLNNNQNLLDLGTGAGFPGIVLKIVSNDFGKNLNIALIEKSKKKCIFLNFLKKQLNIDISIVNQRYEDFKISKKHSIITRAFKNIKETIDLAYKNLSNIENLIMLKGKNHINEINEAEKKYMFHVKKYQSLTSKDSYILKISQINLITT
jgi:16S rRNA (guanine(527)-N(7))-methyltransferase RsmG